jgi:predicted MFS family arabinose efflux permease
VTDQHLRQTPARRRVQLFGLMLIMACSLGLLAYVGYGETWRTYPKFELERLAAQGETVKNAMDPFLMAGLPVSEFPGFVPLTRPLLASDASVGAIYVVDPKGAVLQSDAQSGAPAYVPTAFLASNLQASNNHFTISESPTAYKVALPINNKVEAVGQIVLIMPKSATSAKIDSAFVRPVALAGGGLLLVFLVISLLLISRSSVHPRRALGVSYGVVFFIMAVVVVSSLVNIYSEGIRNKTDALANSLSERLSSPLQLGLDLSDFSQVDTVFQEYKTLYPDLSYVALTDGRQILLDSVTSRVGTQWTPASSDYEYSSPLHGGPAGSSLAVRAGIPKSVIYQEVWRSGKNFFVLFLASGLIAMLFFDLLNTLTTVPSGGLASAETRRAFQEGIVLPFLFLAIFVEAFANSFMPQHLQALARASGLSSSIVSAQFTVYYAALALALIPAGRYVESGRLKSILVLGSVLEVTSLLLMARVSNSYAMFPIRAMAGAAHGILATSVQSYLILLASQNQVTRGASRFLFTYNSGIISGSAIGALLAVYMGFNGVFTLAAVLAMGVLLFGVRLLPNTLDAREATHVVVARAQPPFIPSLGRAVSDFGFVSVVLLVGIPAKIVNAGVIAFALPLLLSRQSVPVEDIGQYMMLYPIGILLMSLMVTRIVTRLGQPRKALIVGTVVGAAAVVEIGLMGWKGLGGADAAAFTTFFLISGIFILGLAHGMINAPMVSFVASTAAAERLGRSTANSIYRFVERLGHMAGPILISQLLFVGQQNAIAIMWVGLPIVVLGVFFWIDSGRRYAAKMRLSIS